MLVQEVIDAVQSQFGDKTGALVTVDDIFRWINDGQGKIARRIGDTQTTQSIPLTLNGAVYNHKYTLATDFFKSLFAELDGRRLQILNGAQMRTMYPSLDSTSGPQGSPKFFAIESIGTNQARIVLAPIPGAAGTIELTYSKRPPIINSTEDTLYLPEEYHSTLVLYCVAQAKQMDGDDQAYLALNSTFKADSEEDAHDARHKDDETYPFIRTSPEDSYYGAGW